jgi:hypothetical protein
MIINHLDLYKHVLSDIGIYLLKNKINFPKRLKPTYLLNYLNKMKQMIK